MVLECHTQGVGSGSDKERKRRIAEPLGEPDLIRRLDFQAKFCETINCFLKGVLTSSHPDITVPILELEFSLSFRVLIVNLGGL